MRQLFIFFILALIPAYNIGDKWSYNDVEVVVVENSSYYVFDYFKNEKLWMRYWWTKENLSLIKEKDFFSGTEFVFKPPAKYFDFPFKLGKNWSSKGVVVGKDDKGNIWTLNYKIDGKVAGLEKISTKLGTFEVYRIELNHSYDSWQYSCIWWWSPFLKWYAKKKGIDYVREITSTNVLPRVIILANSIDYSLANELVQFLNNSLEVTHAYPDDFEKFKKENFIIVLGGPEAPGTGSIVREILIPEEQELIRKEGSINMFVKRDVWKPNQFVFVLAGDNRFTTQKAHKKYREKIIENIYISTSSCTG